jgi:hypothetical protein
MDEKPKRRWFQFRLSTWFVLVAIFGWAFLLHSKVIFWYDSIPVAMSNSSVQLGAAINWQPTGRTVYWQVTIGIELLYPALALAAFLAWKTAWAVVERRRRRSAATE